MTKKPSTAASQVTCQMKEDQAHGETEETNRKWDQKLLNPQQFATHESCSLSGEFYFSCNKTSLLWTLWPFLAQSITTTKHPGAQVLTGTVLSWSLYWLSPTLTPQFHDGWPCCWVPFLTYSRRIHYLVKSFTENKENGFLPYYIIFLALKYIY